MLLKQINYFLAVVDNKSFTEAAKKCGVSQSAISQQIGALEESLGTKLLDRHNRTFTLTEAGKYFYDNARDVKERTDKMMEEARKIGQKASIA